MRALARWGITPLLAAPLGAWAFGLGDIELQSALNQPFQAQIALVSATPEDIQGLRINLAGEDAFDRIGVDRPGFLLQFEFRVVTDRNGRAFVQVTSRESITEPFVTLVVEATWPRGRSLKEYTVLLDPPVLLPVPTTTAPPVQPPQTRPQDSSAPGGQINRPQPAPSPQPVRPQPVQPAQPAQTAPRPSPSEAPPVSRVPEVAPEGSYGPVQRAETLWAIAERFRPAGVSMNQMMVAMFEANPQAFGGNMNVLHVGAVLRMPQASDLQQLTVSAANTEAQRQTDEWQNRTPQERRLVLVPPSESSVTPSRNAAPAPTPAVPPAAARAAEEEARAAAAATAAAAAAEERRLLQLEAERLAALQERAGGEQPPAETPAPNAVPGVELESEPLFADETPAPATPEPAATPPAPTPTPVATPAEPEGPSLVSQIVGWITSPLLLIAVGVAALLLAALWFVRRRRETPEDVTGRWEALESEVDDENVRAATERLRRQAPEASIVVEEQAARPRRPDADAAGDETRLRSGDETRLRPAAQRPQRAAAPAPEETLSSQTVINLDQADPVAEADFHMAYGLYDQAAELVQKALDAAPTRRDLKLKLLEVFFVWGNKDAFLSAAQKLRKEIGSAPDADWDKVVIMGKQICPDERLFAEAASAGGHVDVDLQAGDSPLDLAFDEAPEGGVDLDLGGSDDSEFELEPTREMEVPPVRQPARPSPVPKELGDSLDIGERTAAGLEAALLEETQKDDAGSRTTPDLAAFDSLAVTQESPTIERTRDWSRITQEAPTAQYASVDSPTVESPTIESAGPDSPTMETPTVETPFRRAESPTVEQPGLGIPTSDRTAEIDLDDLGLDVKDLEDLPQDLGDLPAGKDSDTRRQPALKDDDLLSATGVTQVLRGGEDEDDFEQRKTSVLSDADATMLAPSFDDGTLTGTEVLEHRLAVDESGDTSLVKSLRKEDKDKLDLNLDDLSAALHGADTVEQPRASSFSHDVFGGGDTPLDMDIGSDVVGADDPTGTEEVSPLDPQTMTEVGTKLDLARAYIDMGDPEGARSILEEVLDEGDPNQRREAQSLIDVLSA